MYQKRNNCPLCKGTKESATTTFTVDLKFGVVVVRDVPAMVCSQCGEEWIADQEAAELEKIVQDARKKHAMIEVTSYTDLKMAS